LSVEGFTLGITEQRMRNGKASTRKGFYSEILAASGENLALRVGDNSLLGYLSTIETVSGLTPFVSGLSWADFTRRVISETRRKLGITTKLECNWEGFPNPRGNIEYFFSSPPYGIAVGGKLTEETALRILFFVAHGIGHAMQESNPDKRMLSEMFIHPTSSRIASKGMNDLVEIQGKLAPFWEFFTPHEREATQLGWAAIERLIGNRYAKRLMEEVRFWYSLFGVLDHLYHRQCIAGPFPPERGEWIKVFAQKLEALLMSGILAEIEKIGTNSAEDFECIYAGTDGWFYWATGAVKAAIGSLRKSFFAGDFDPFPRIKLGSLPKFPKGKSFNLAKARYVPGSIRILS
jgi:hypothetical protein